VKRRQTYAAAAPATGVIDAMNGSFDARACCRAPATTAAGLVSAIYS